MIPKVSVLFPNYNNGPYLKEALDSIFNQSFEDFIIYFVDDCSTDNSLEIAKSYQDERLIILEKDKNSGIVDTMNLGLDKIETEYFIRMDGDDISVPNRFKTLVDFMDEHPDIGVCSSFIKTFGKVNQTIAYEADPDLNKANLIFCHSIGHASSIFRTSVFKENQIKYEDKFWRMEDYLLFYTLKSFTNTTSIPDELYLYRREDYNYNQEIFDKKSKEFERFYSMIFKELNFDGNVKTHLELGGRQDLSQKYAVYKKHVMDLLNSNRQNKLFPPQALEKVLNGFLEKAVFRLIDQRQINIFALIPHFFKIDGLFRHYVKKKLNRL